MVKIGFIAIGRPTFDVEYAQEHAEAAHGQLSGVAEVMGTPELMMDEVSADSAAQRIQAGDPDAVVVFQATFADSTLVQAVADRIGAPLVLWATREERTGGRLRLNSFCGTNLAGYALARRSVDYRWVYGSPIRRRPRRRGRCGRDRTVWVHSQRIRDSGSQTPNTDPQSWPHRTKTGGIRAMRLRCRGLA